MKKILSLTLAILMLLAGLTIPAAAEQPPQGPGGDGPAMKTGILTLLNTTADEYAAYKIARQAAYDMLIQDGSVQMDELSGADAVGQGPADEGAEEAAPPVPPEGVFPVSEGENPPASPAEGDRPAEIIFFDSLDAMIMALEAGQIDSMEIYQRVAGYLCANRDGLTMIHSIDLTRERAEHAESTIQNRLSNDFSFLMAEGSTELRDLFNTAILAMKEDGTLDRLIQEQIIDLIDGKEIAPVELPTFEGADPITVAVTGDLPPMDYVAADGTPAGFNTAVLAEIGRRIERPIRLVVVTGPARAAALASGQADAVFWTRTNAAASAEAELNEEEREAKRKEYLARMPERVAALMEQLETLAPVAAISGQDMPQGTIVTEAYYHDVLVPVELARTSKTAE